MAGYGFPDRLCFTCVLARAVVGFFAETDDETDAFVEQVDHFAKADVGKRFVEPDAAVSTDNAGSDVVLSQGDKDVFDGLRPDIGQF